MSATPLSLGTQGRFDVGNDIALSLGTQGRLRIDDGVTPPPFDPSNAGPGGSPLRDRDAEAEHRRLVLDDEQVIMQVIKKFLEMQRDA